MSEHFREAVIDEGAITANTRRMVEMTGVAVIAVVKADAYGHGSLATARAALRGGATSIAVADITEAIYLRTSGVSAPILCWLHAPDESFEQAVDLGIDLAISSFDQLQRVQAAATARRRARIHLKLDTGLSRNGVSPSDWARVVAEAARLERIGRIELIGIFGHVSNASREDDLAALDLLEEAISYAAEQGLKPQLRHIAATAAAIDIPEARLDAVRIGIGIYGLSPFADRTPHDLGLVPAMTLRARVAAVRRVAAGTGVSYDYAYRTEKETTLALVPLGYADGIPRAASGRGPVLIGGRRFTVPGRIAMDQFVVDVGDLPVEVGDEVVLFGKPSTGAPSADEWAHAADTINYEIVTRIGARVPRVPAP